VRVFVATGDQIGLTRFVEASTTTVRFVFPEMMNPNPFVLMPNLGLVGCISVGSVTLGRLTHASKASSPMLVRPFGIVTLDRRVKSKRSEILIAREAELRNADLSGQFLFRSCTNSESNAGNTPWHGRRFGRH